MATHRRGPLVLLALLLVAAMVAVAVWALRDDAPEPERPAPRAATVQPARAAPPRRGPERVAPPPAPPRTARPPAERPVPARRDPEAVTLRNAVKVHVVVRRSDGGAAAGALVYALDPLGELTVPPGSPVRIRKTADESGRAEFDIAGGTTVLRFLASLDGEAAASDGLDVGGGGERDVELTLAPGATPRVRVTDDAGAAVAGASVRVERSGGDETWPLVVQALTDGAGDAQLPAIPTGDVPWSLEIGVSAFGFAPATRDVGPKEVRDGAVVVVLTRAATVRGRCVDEAGAPVVGASVRVAPQDVRGRTDAEGRFAIAGLPAAGGWLAVEHKAFAPSVVSDVTPSGDVADVGDIAMRPGAPIAGVVLDAEGKPAAGAQVEVANAAALWARVAVADAEGRFVVEHAADLPHDVEAKEPHAAGRDWATVRTAKQSGVRPGADVRLQFTGALSVHVRFLDETDRSPVVVSSVKLTAAAVGTTPAAFAWAWAGSNLDAVRFQPGNAGVFDVTVEIPGYEAATAKAVEVSADRETRIEVLFRRR